MSKTFKTLAIASIALTAASCQDDGPESSKVTPYKPIELSADTRSAVEAGNEFSLGLFKTLPEEENCVISPYSIFSTLSMMANADEDAARDEILAKFGYSNGEAGLNALNSYCRTMNNSLSGLDGRVIVKMSNSLWTESEPTSSFLTTLTENYNGEWIRKSPKGEVGMAAVNKFVAKNTENLILEFLTKPLDIDIMLLNTVYFNGKWQQEIDKDLTKPAKFHNIDGKISTTPFMVADGTFNVFGDDNFTFVELPYGSGNFTMTLLMPTDKIAFGDLRQSLSGSRLNKMITDMESIPCTVFLPKFKTKQKIELESNLRDMGFNKIFDDRYSNLITGESASLNQLQHATSIEVDEDGTKAAAATEAGWFISPGPGSEIRFNSPFIYMIRETSTNTILFIGQITNF